MKLVHKIILGNVLGIISIILISAFSYREFDLVLTKLRFVEIADSLNASFLKMRLSEKNYLLYQDGRALESIRDQIQQSYLTIEDLRPEIVKAVGRDNFLQLQSYLRKYEEQVDRVGNARMNQADSETRIRKAGRDLRFFSANIMALERASVNDILSASRRTLLVFFSLVILVAITSTYLFFSRMFQNLRRIERTANAISAGCFERIDGRIPDNELGSAMAAINSMCEELETRHEQLIQSRKLASLGILTSGVAHELGNPLNNIAMLAQTFLEIYDQLPREERLEYMNSVLEECERIRKIVQDLLDFSRPKKSVFRPASINEVVRHSLRLVQNTLDISGIESESDFQEDLPPVLIDEDRIREVLVNLLNNAAHAMPSGGTIEIRTALADKTDHVVIEVQDSGQGIPAEHLPHIFDPFFSTKGTEGTGLGLSISYGIIRKHKGEISVRSEPGRGTTFTIKLPVYRAEEENDGAQSNHGDR